MTTLASAIGPGDGTIQLSGVLDHDVEYVQIDAEVMKINFGTDTTVGVKRGYGGSAKVSHDSGSTVTPVYPYFIANPPNGTIPEMGSPTLDEVLVNGNTMASGQTIIGATGAGGTGGNLEMLPGTLHGGDVILGGGAGDAGKDGGAITMAAGIADSGVTNIAGAGLFLDCGYANGTPGRAGITTGDSQGTTGQIPVADGLGTFVWSDKDVAANVAVIATPASATAEDDADKINAVINALVAAGLMAAP